MKRLLYITAVLLFASQYSSLYAQTEDTDMRVSVCVGEERLENLLTDEQKDNVTHLAITGIMTEEDYAFIRSNRLKQIVELNLRDADIDTIPPHALDFIWNTASRYNTIVLPICLKYLSDYSLSFDPYNYGGKQYTYVFTGDYPKVGCNIYNSDLIEYRDGDKKYVSSDDNPFLKNENGFLYSSDGTKLYLADNFCGEIAYGTKVINERAFENMYADYSQLVLPETIDSIGDRAFAGLGIRWITSNGVYDWGYMTCLAVNPPKLGKDVFYVSKPWPSMFNYDGVVLYVPDGCEELYRAAEGWNQFSEICPLSQFHGSGVKNVVSNKCLSVKEQYNEYVLQSSKCIDKVTGFCVNGSIVFNRKVDASNVSILKKSFVSPYTILRIVYEDGTNETVKLKP